MRYSNEDTYDKTYRLLYEELYTDQYKDILNTIDRQRNRSIRDIKRKIRDTKDDIKYKADDIKYKANVAARKFYRKHPEMIQHLETLGDKMAYSPLDAYIKRQEFYKKHPEIFGPIGKAFDKAVDKSIDVGSNIKNSYIKLSNDLDKKYPKLRDIKEKVVDKTTDLIQDYVDKGDKINTAMSIFGSTIAPGSKGMTPGQRIAFLQALKNISDTGRETIALNTFNKSMGDLSYLRNLVNSRQPFTHKDKRILDRLTRDSDKNRYYLKRYLGPSNKVGLTMNLFDIWRYSLDNPVKNESVMIEYILNKYLNKK